MTTERFIPLFGSDRPGEEARYETVPRPKIPEMRAGPAEIVRETYRLDDGRTQITWGKAAFPAIPSYSWPAGTYVRAVVWVIFPIDQVLTPSGATFTIYRGALPSSVPADALDGSVVGGRLVYPRYRYTLTGLLAYRENDEPESCQVRIELQRNFSSSGFSAPEMLTLPTTRIPMTPTGNLIPDPRDITDPVRRRIPGTGTADPNWF